MRLFKVLVLLTLLAAVPILAAEEPTRVAANPLAAMHITPDGVSWEVEGGLGDLELAVAGPDGAVVRRQFAAGEAPTLDLLDARGERLADGVYTYELRTARELRPGRSLLLSGSILVRDAGFIDPAAGRSDGPVEKRPGRGGGLRSVTEAIVDDGACFGADCVTGDDGFGLRLKDSFLQIIFDDTYSPVAPSNDWAIQINDDPGGLEYFAIQDLGRDSVLFSTPFRILAGAPDHSLFVNGSGNIGLGTSIPSAKLHVPSGEVRFDSSHATLETHFKFSGNSQNYLRGTTIIADDATGSNVGIGCDGPGSDLVVGGTASSCATAPWSRINAGDASWSSSSSRTFKENLSPVQVPDLLEKMAGVGVYTYDFIKGPKDRIGLMAEDFHQIFGRGSDKEIDGSEVEMALWLAVRELTARIAVLEARLAEKAEAQ